MASALPPFCFGWESLGALTPRHPKECRMNAEIGAKIEPEAADGETPAANPGGVLQFAGFEVDLGRGELRVGGAAVSLRPKTFALLAYLAGHPGRLLTKDELIEAVWPDVTVTDDSLVQCVSEVRAALRDDGQGLIKTVPRRGYLFEATPVETAHADEAPGRPERCPPHDAPRRPAARSWSLPLLALWRARSRSPARSGSRLRIGGQTGAIVSKQTITILPLAGVGGQNAADLAEAVTEDLTIEVSRLPDTLVIAPPARNAAAGARDEHRPPTEHLCPERQPAAAGRSGFDRGEIAGDSQRRAAVVGAVRLWRAGRMELASRHHGAHRQ